MNKIRDEPVNGKPWKKRETYWDTDTGEKITKKQSKKYDIIKYGKTIKYTEKYFNVAEKQYYCRTEQIRLF